MRSAAQGRGNAAIAAHLHLSEFSAEKHVNAIFTKLGLTTEDLSHRRVTAVLTFQRGTGLRGTGLRGTGLRGTGLRGTGLRG